jgi:hypothetical protein
VLTLGTIIRKAAFFRQFWLILKNPGEWQMFYEQGLISSVLDLKFLQR